MFDDSGTIARYALLHAWPNFRASRTMINSTAARSAIGFSQDGFDKILGLGKKSNLEYLQLRAQYESNLPIW
jgi:hypothetical protein